MDGKNNGGPAFPGPDQQEQRENIHEGMTLRDYFAAQVIARTCDGVSVCDEQGVYERFATHAYRMADAMLHARGAC